jgi:hypothetical protein
LFGEEDLQYDNGGYSQCNKARKINGKIEKEEVKLFAQTYNPWFQDSQ